MEKIFYIDDFDNSEKITEITQEINCNEFLTPEQEFFLFRKMNYYKHIKNYEKAIKTRNQIVEHNLRLANQLGKFLYKKTDVLDHLSDAHCDIITAVDYFDYRKGYRFSTYATWVIKRNYFRNKKKIKLCQNVLTLEHDVADTAQISNYMETESFISDLLLKVKRKCKDADRKIFIIKSFFGLGTERMTLQEISNQLRISKERVRQIKEQTLSWMLDHSKSQDYALCQKD